MSNIPESVWERFNNHTSSESELRAIWEENEASAKPCPDLAAFLYPILWQLERMDVMDGIEPHMGDAMAVLDEIASE